MTDTYQAVYDAVRSKLGNCDVGSAVESAIRDANISHYVEQAGHLIQQAASAYDNPSVLYRPKIYVDGNQWCALYGDDLQSGVAGFGDTPHAAMHDFDCNWYKKLGEKK